MALKITLFESLKDPPLASPIRLLSSKSGSSLRAGPNCCPVWSGQKRPQLPQRLHDVRDSKANQSLLHQAFTDEHFWNFSVGVQKLWSHTLPYMGLAPLRQPLAGTCLYKKTGVCTALRCLLHTMPSTQLSKVALVPTFIFELRWFTVGLFEASCSILHVEEHNTHILCTCIYIICVFWKFYRAVYSVNGCAFLLLTRIWVLQPPLLQEHGSFQEKLQHTRRAQSRLSP